MDKPTKTAEELSKIVLAEVTRRVGPTSLRQGVMPAVVSMPRETSDRPNWTADPAVWGELFAVRFHIVWEETLGKLQGQYDLQD